MDGIAVDSEFKGQGIGSLLLDNIVTYALENGFVALKTESFPYLKWLVDFSGATTMKLELRKFA